MARSLNDYLADGTAASDAVALITAGRGDPVDTGSLNAAILGMAEDGAPRMAAALTMLGGLAAQFLESWAEEAGRDPGELLRDFALLHQTRRHG